jgi:hypothetical protein
MNVSGFKIPPGEAGKTVWPRQRGEEQAYTLWKQGQDNSGGGPSPNQFPVIRASKR